MVSDQFQVRRQKRIVFYKVQQVVRAGARGTNPAPGEVFPNGYPRCTAGTDARLPLIAALPGLHCFVKLCLDLGLPIVHRTNYTMSSTLPAFICKKPCYGEERKRRRFRAS